MPVDVRAGVTGTVWKIVASVGDALDEDEEIAILESMKMEIPIECPVDGKLVELCVKEGDAVREDTVIARVEED